MAPDDVAPARWQYVVHGLVVSLPFPTELLIAASIVAVPQVVVSYGPVADALDEVEIREAGYEVAPSAFLYRAGPRSARFLALDGRTITIDRATDCDPVQLAFHLLYHVLAAILRQRAMLVFHGSAAVRGDRGVIVMGQSGAGKSTTIARLMTMGWHVHGDDISTLRPADGRLEMPAGTRHLHLDQSGAGRIGVDTDGLVQHDWHRMKMAIPAADAVARPAVPIDRIVSLEVGDVPALRVSHVKGRAKLPFLLGGLYGPYLPSQIDARSDLIARTLAEVELLSIVRPAGEWTNDAVVAAIADRN